MAELKYGVRYEDNIGPEDTVMWYATEEEADAAIEKELDSTKTFFFDELGLDYDYADFGSKTEIWGCGNDEYASWDRLWI